MHLSKTFPLLLMAVIFTSCGTSEKKDVGTAVDTPPETKTEETVSYVVNTDKSMVRWRGSILSVKAHEGTMNFQSGKFSAKGTEVLEGTFVVDMASMVATDENYQPEEGKTKEKLIGHLSSPDFFDVAKFPQSILSIVDGKATLTVRGHAKGVDLKNVTMEANGDNATASAEFVFDRQDFGVSFDMGMADMAISDEITVKVDIDAVRI